MPAVNLQEILRHLDQMGVCAPADLISVLKQLEAFGPIIDGYFDHHAMLMHPSLVSWISTHLARFGIFETQKEDLPDVILAVDNGDVRLANRIAELIMWSRPKHSVLSMFCELDAYREIEIRQPAFKRLIAGRKVCIVQSVATTGTPGKQVVEAVRALGGIVNNYLLVLNRGPKPGQLVTTSDLGEVPNLYSLMTRFDLTEQSIP